MRGSSRIAGRNRPDRAVTNSRSNLRCEARPAVAVMKAPLPFDPAGAPMLGRRHDSPIQRGSRGVGGTATGRILADRGNRAKLTASRRKVSACAQWRLSSGRVRLPCDRNHSPAIGTRLDVTVDLVGVWRFPGGQRLNAQVLAVDPASAAESDRPTDGWTIRRKGQTRAGLALGTLAPFTPSLSQADPFKRQMKYHSPMDERGLNRRIFTLD